MGLELFAELKTIGLLCVPTSVTLPEFAKIPRIVALAEGLVTPPPDPQGSAPVDAKLMQMDPVTDPKQV
jgi:hypothetical protein